MDRRTRVLSVAGLVASLVLPILAPSSGASAQPREPFRVEAILEGDGAGLTNSQASHLAVDGSPTLAAADAALAAAETAITRATVALWPTLTLSARYTRFASITNDPLVEGLVTGPEAAALVAGVDDPEARALWSTTLAQQEELSESRIPWFPNQLMLEARVSVPVSEIFLTLLPRLEAARAAVEAEEARREVTLQGLDRRARVAFYGYVRARAFAALAEQRLRDAAEEHRLAVRSRELGVVRRSEVLRAEAGLARARAGVERAEAGVLSAGEALRSLLRLPGQAALRVGEDVTAPLPEVESDLTQMIDQAFARRPEAVALRRAAEASRRGQRAAEGSGWPTLRLGAGVQLANPNRLYTPNRDRFDPTWDISVIVAWSPNQTVVSASQAASAAAEAARLNAELDRFRDGLRAEVSGAWADDRSAAATVAEARALVESAREAYRARRIELELGESRFADVLDAERELTEARVALIEASIGARVARVSLSYATGGAVPMPEG